MLDSISDLLACRLNFPDSVGQSLLVELLQLDVGIERARESSCFQLISLVFIFYDVNFISRDCDIRMQDFVSQLGLELEVLQLLVGQLDLLVVKVSKWLETFIEGLSPNKLRVKLLLFL